MSTSPTASSQTTAVRYRIAISDHAGGQLLAVTGGTLEGQINSDGTACLWLGSNDQRTAMVWPQGFTATGPPLAVLDQSGAVVGAVGKHVDITGGLFVPTSPLLGCAGFNRAWAVGSVQS